LNHKFPKKKKTREKELKQPNLFNLIANMSHKKVNGETYQELEQQASVKLGWSWSKQVNAQQKTKQVKTPQICYKH